MESSNPQNNLSSIGTAAQPIQMRKDYGVIKTLSRDQKLNILRFVALKEDYYGDMDSVETAVAEQILSDRRDSGDIHFLPEELVLDLT